MKTFFQSLFNSISVEDTFLNTEQEDMERLIAHAKKQYGLDFVVIRSKADFVAYAFTQAHAAEAKTVLRIPQDTVIPADGAVVIGKSAWNANILAHEIGHLIVNKKTGLRQVNTVMTRAMVKGMTIGAGIVKLSRASHIKHVGIGIAMIVVAETPRLVEEASASYYGKKLLRELGLPDSGTMNAAFATYVRQAILSPITGSGLGEVFATIEYRFLK